MPENSKSLSSQSTRSKPILQSRYWCGTWNNYEESDLQSLMELAHQTNGPITYAVIGREVGESGTRHLQIYLEFSKRVRLAGLRRLCGGRGGLVHWEHRLGSAEQASTYCMKDSQYDEIGEISVPNKGERNDLNSVYAFIKEGHNMRDIAEEYPNEVKKFQRGIHYLKMLWTPPRTWKTEVVVLWGKTGTGKTRHVWDTHGSDIGNVYAHPGGMWFDGYDSHDVVLFDDFSGSCFPLPYFLKITDRYPMMVPVKGFFVQWVPRIIYITSNVNPNDWYPGAYPEHRNALRRRFTKVTHFNGTIMEAVNCPKPVADDGSWDNINFD